MAANGSSPPNFTEPRSHLFGAYNGRLPEPDCAVGKSVSVATRWSRRRVGHFRKRQKIVALIRMSQIHTQQPRSSENPRMKSPGEVGETIGSWLENALLKSDGPAHFASPYLAYAVCRKLAEAAERSRQPFVLLTALEPSAVANGYLSVQGLKRLVNSGVLVHHVDRLHAKCFIVGSKGALGSANLTGSGLGSSVSPNRELSIVLTPE